jgi:hypothetical protein
VVHLVEVDVVGLQAAQGGVDRAADVQGGEAAIVPARTHLAEDLGRQHDLVALPAAGEPAADDLLGAALVLLPAVDVRGVHEGDALLQGAVEDREGVLLRGVGAEVHRAEHESGDGGAGAAELGVLHR